MNKWLDFEKVLVTFIIVVRNGENHIRNLLGDFLSQDFPKDQIELIIVDSNSTDNTRKIIDKFIHENPTREIRVFDNPKIILSTGWNIALREAKGAIILRVDVHSRIPVSFVSRNVFRIRNGESICGGFLQAVVSKDPWAQLISIADKSRFGGSSAPFRNPGQARYVDSVAYAAYRREVFEKVGGYDERLVRNQDNEIHYRMHIAGYKFFFDPEIQSSYIGRNTLRSLLKQKFLNGYWVGITLGISPFCFKLRHFIPFLFTFGIILTLIFALSFPPIFQWASLPFNVLMFTYVLCALMFSYNICINEKDSPRINRLFLPFIFFCIHYAYGLGTILGIFCMPFFIFRNRKYKQIWPMIKCDLN